MSLPRSIASSMRRRLQRHCYGRRVKSPDDYVGGESETILGKQSGLGNGTGREGLIEVHILRSAETIPCGTWQTDHYIDLYQSHTDDADTPFEETLGAYAELIAQGKVRAIGASNYTADRLLAALEVSKKTGLPQYQSLQPNYNLFDRAEYETQP